ncbi:hypothetical protein ACFXPM_27275 [Streptomyces sp. NPDC059095]
MDTQLRDVLQVGHSLWVFLVRDELRQVVDALPPRTESSGS